MEQKINNEKVVVVAAALIKKEDKFLLTKSFKWSDKWSIQGGKIEVGEKSEETTKREILEETNLNIKNLKLIKVAEEIFPKEYHKKKHFIFFEYLADYESGEIKLNEEHQEHGWFTLNEALKLDLNEPTRNLINHVIPLIYSKKR